MSKRTISTLIISVTLATISIAGYFYTVTYVGGMGSSLSDMYAKSVELKKEEESLSSIQRVAQNADQRNAELSKYIVPSGNEGSIQFVQTIENLAESFGLTYNTNSIEIVSDEKLAKLDKEYLSIKETLNGSSKSIAGFVEKIETLPLNTKIRSYSVTKTAGSKGTSTVEQLDIEILVIKEK
jgi:hypothetical protein